MPAAPRALHNLLKANVEVRLRQQGKKAAVGPLRAVGRVGSAAQAILQRSGYADKTFTLQTVEEVAVGFGLAEEPWLLFLPAGVTLAPGAPRPKVSDRDKLTPAGIEIALQYQACAPKIQSIIKSVLATGLTDEAPKKSRPRKKD